MLGRIFPKQIDNTYSGYWPAVWLLVPLVLVKLVMGINVMINTRDIIEGVDGIPLSTFSVEAQGHLIFSFQAWALELALLAALGLLALVRYRAMIPLVYLLLLAENGGRKAISLASGAPLIPPGGPTTATLINLSLIAALAIGFALSIGNKKGPLE
jgi:hypothetical protein